VSFDLSEGELGLVFVVVALRAAARRFVLPWLAAWRNS